MSLSKDINSYTDVRPVLDTALQADQPVFITFNNVRSATYWRARAYMFRRLYQQHYGPSAYDSLRLTISAKGSVRIEQNTPPVDFITTASGENITVAPVDPRTGGLAPRPIEKEAHKIEIGKHENVSASVKGFLEAAANVWEEEDEEDE